MSVVVLGRNFSRRCIGAPLASNKRNTEQVSISFKRRRRSPGTAIVYGLRNTWRSG
jgi:hypothetical protein